MNDLERRMAGAVEELRRMPAPSPFALARMRRALRAQAAVSPRIPPRIGLTPFAAVSATLAVVALTSLGWFVAGEIGRDDATEERTPVQFVLHAPGARGVALVGDFNDWDPEAVAMEPAGGGVWSVVVPLPAGTIRYSFLVNGVEWRADPNAAASPGGFGQPSSIALVRSPGAGP